MKILINFKHLNLVYLSNLNITQMQSVEKYSFMLPYILEPLKSACA